MLEGQLAEDAHDWFDEQDELRSYRTEDSHSSLGVPKGPRAKGAGVLPTPVVPSQAPAIGPAALTRADDDELILVAGVTRQGSSSKASSPN